MSDSQSERPDHFNRPLGPRPTAGLGRQAAPKLQILNVSHACTSQWTRLLLGAPGLVAAQEHSS